MRLDHQTYVVGAKLRNAGLPRAGVWSVAFDPGHSGRLYCSVPEEAVYVSDDASYFPKRRIWPISGLPTRSTRSSYTSKAQ